MADQFPGQHENETIDLVFRQHPIVMRRIMIYALGAFTLSAVPMAIWPLTIWPLWVLLGGFVIALLIFGYRFIGWYFSVYIITSERFIQVKQKGFFDRRVVDISHNRILSVNYKIKGLQATLFKFGTIIVQTYAGDLVLRYITHPEDVQQHLNKIIRNVKPVTPAELNEENASHERTIQEA